MSNELAIFFAITLIVGLLVIIVWLSTRKSASTQPSYVEEEDAPEMMAYRRQRSQKPQREQRGSKLEPFLPNMDNDSYPNASWQQKHKNSVKGILENARKVSNIDRNVYLREVRDFAGSYTNNNNHLMVGRERIDASKSNSVAPSLAKSSHAEDSVEIF